MQLFRRVFRTRDIARPAIAAADSASAPGRARADVGRERPAWAPTAFAVSVQHCGARGEQWNENFSRRMMRRREWFAAALRVLRNGGTLILLCFFVAGRVGLFVDRFGKLGELFVGLA